LLVAITEVSAEQGVANVTVAGVVARAGVSRRTFYDLFEDRQQCFLAALDAAIEHASQRVRAACDPSAAWHERIRTGLAAFLSFLDDNCDMARLMLVESLGAGRLAHERRDRLLAMIVPVIEEGRRDAKREPPPLIAEGLIGGVLSVVHARLAGRDPRPLLELVSHLTSMIVLPYRGTIAANTEFATETPAHVSASAPPGEENPLRGLHTRLTYRTVRVLSAISANPDSSNRVLAEAAEITDQGQISKLLSRLESLNLIENRSAGALRGGPNAWRLTQHGLHIQRVLAPPG
jgi:AcrR family transcriptional regulator